jgi:hypothetical protein
MAMPSAPYAAPLAAGPAPFAAPSAPAPPEPSQETPRRRSRFDFLAEPAAAEEPAYDYPDTAPQIPQAPRANFGPSFPDVATPMASGRSAFDPTGAVTGPQMLHIPCPNGHELETPPEMLGEEVICPHCGKQFTLREKDSLEFKRKKREQQEKQDIRSGKNWLTWSVIIAVAVLLGLIVMIAVGTW